MIASAHLGAGLVAGMAASRMSGSTGRRIAIAFVLGVATHVAFDATPHTDYGELRGPWIIPILAGEALAVFGLANMILRHRVTRSQLVFLAMGLLGSALPDAHFVRHFLPTSLSMLVVRPTFWFHSFFHAEPTNFWFGMATQVAAAWACMLVLFAFPRVRATDATFPKAQ